ncbi:TPA: type I toxin-antitoxin system Ibs family toxin [Escherichia coli]|nr:type I toxin-antitoxin system Ibs family toxin [Escherichia coli]HBC5883266.1 type I toxin-antitoxin system Ibs family toxin [Escherichia coli]HDK0571560.1 type I toxin-antitoxin system Ibs family toxin [Escherichia coli]
MMKHVIILEILLVISF